MYARTPIILMKYNAMNRYNIRDIYVKYRYFVNNRNVTPTLNPKVTITRIYNNYDHIIQPTLV